MYYPCLLRVLCSVAAIFILNSQVLTIAAAQNKQSVGKAKVYSDSLSGKKTASGEPYKKAGMTAASPNLPIGSKVLVKNKKNGKSAVVIINDREGKGGGKVVDLSKAAANKVGVKGTASYKPKYFPVAIRNLIESDH